MLKKSLLITVIRSIILMIGKSSNVLSFISNEKGDLICIKEKGELLWKRIIRKGFF